MHLWGEAGLSPTAFSEGLWSLLRGPAGVQNAMEGFENYAGSSKCRLGKRLSASRQSTNYLDSQIQVQFYRERPHGVAPKNSDLAARRHLGPWFPKEVILSPRSGLPALWPLPVWGIPSDSATGIPSAPSTRARAGFQKADRHVRNPESTRSILRMRSLRVWQHTPAKSQIGFISLTKR